MLSWGEVLCRRRGIENQHERIRFDHRPTNINVKSKKSLQDADEEEFDGILVS